VSFPSPRRAALWFLAALAAAGSVASLAACLGEDVTAGTEGAGTEQDASSRPPVESPSDPGADGGSTPAPSDAGVDAAPLTFCSTAPRPDAGDFFCADFDGPDFTAGLTRSAPDAGTVKRVTDIFFSEPAAVEVGDGTTLVWEKTGPAPVAAVEARVRVNVANLGGIAPNAAGSVALLELRTVDSQFSLRFARGATVEGSAYTGYYLRSSSCPNACAVLEKRMTGVPTANTWTELRFSWASSGAVQLSFNGVEALPVGYTSFGSTSTRASVLLGLAASASPPIVPRHAFDNLRVTVTRQ
jgi:hypothetical protein